MAEATVDNTIKIDNTVENTGVAERANAIETADTFELARNPIYVNLQHKLIENTDSLERMRCVFSQPPSAVSHELTCYKEMPTLNLYWRWERTHLTLSLTGMEYKSWLCSTTRSVKSSKTSDDVRCSLEL